MAEFNLKNFKVLSTLGNKLIHLRSNIETNNISIKLNFKDPEIRKFQLEKIIKDDIKKISLFQKKDIINKKNNKYEVKFEKNKFIWIFTFNKLKNIYSFKEMIDSNLENIKF